MARTRKITEDDPRSRQAVASRMQRADRSLRKPTAAANKQARLNAGAAARAKRFDAVPRRRVSENLVQRGKPRVQQIAPASPKGMRKKKIGPV